MPLIEPRVRGLVAALNANGLCCTIASCQGHFLGSRDPYVYFTSDLRAASRIEAVLQSLWRDGTLNYYWLLKAQFNNELQLCFRLSSPALAHSGSRWFLLFWRYVIWRRRIDEDLCLIECAVKQVLDEKLYSINANQVNGDGRR